MPPLVSCPLRGCPEGFPLGQTGPIRAGFLGTKNTSGYPDQDRAGMVKASVKAGESGGCRGAHDRVFVTRKHYSPIPVEPARSAAHGF